MARPIVHLARWLKKAPMPHTIRYTTTEEDEPRELALGTSGRRWKEAEETLETSGAVRVECLDKEGTLLRSGVLPGHEDEASDDAARADRRAEAARAKETAALATVLDAQGRRISEAFEKGAEAASRGQENLVDVVQLLTSQWSATMQSLHNVSMNLANILIKYGGGEPEDTNGAQLQQLLGMAAMRMMGGGAGGEAPKPPNAKPNGGK